MRALVSWQCQEHDAVLRSKLGQLWPWRRGDAAAASSGIHGIYGYACGIKGEAEGKRCGAYREPAGVLSVLGGGSMAPESRRRSSVTEVEDDVEELEWMAPGEAVEHGGPSWHGG